ncbi:MAG: hypothetical protein K9M00_01805 [Candidatus Omnitrophica bacterium]|nr:hypothetical protein [Candidatus Omnitrophota bacterium]
MTEEKKKEEKSQKSNVTESGLTGKISETIGTGPHAQTAITWLVIKWSFIVGSALTIIILIAAKYDICEFIFANIWSVFGSIIMLALGYLFGKGKE